MLRPVLCLLLVACAGAPVEPDPVAEAELYDPGEPGPYTAGVQTRVFVDARGKELTVEIWYPASVSESATPDPYTELPISVDAHRMAHADRSGAPYPLVGFSHGLGGIRFQSAFLTEHLATHGFVVVAPDHPGSILLTVDNDDPTWVLERPGDVASAIDHVLAVAADGEDGLAGMTDAETYGVMGHSFGAITAMAVGGGELDFEQGEAWCADNDGSGCKWLDRINEYDPASHQTVDPRATTAVLLSPGAWYIFGEDGGGLEEMGDTLVMGGDADGVLPYDTEIRPVYDALGAPRALATIADTGHYASFSDLCTLFQTSRDCGGEAEGYIAKEVGQAITRPIVTSWFKTRIAGDERYEAFLTADVLGAVEGLTWED